MLSYCGHPYTLLLVSVDVASLLSTVNTPWSSTVQQSKIAVAVLNDAMVRRPRSVSLAENI